MFFVLDWIVVLVTGTAFSEDDLTRGPGAFVFTHSLDVHQSLDLLRGPCFVHLLLPVLLEASFHVKDLLEAVGGDSVWKVIIQRESTPVLLALGWIGTLVQMSSVLNSPATYLFSSSLSSSCSVYAWTQLCFPALSSQASSPAAVAVIWPCASPSFPSDQCGNLSHSWGQTRLRAAGAWESGYSRAQNPTLHFLFPGPPWLGKRWAVVVQGVRGAGAGCGWGLSRAFPRPREEYGHIRPSSWRLMGKQRHDSFSVDHDVDSQCWLPDLRSTLRQTRSKGDNKPATEPQIELWRREREEGRAEEMKESYKVLSERENSKLAF
ncbi:hypothetical protein FQN60_010343 [Etheostoma spectabile]|uniref:Uncharacterized protein n=1 Tax=Etheostoma spectabile TaxID=54343 RepID=A0A5J5D2U1_9PERO|nr:hypothetical protein FQN60_010343 [Etheostoma spectabile]